MKKIFESFKEIKVNEGREPNIVKKFLGKTHSGIWHSVEYHEALKLPLEFFDQQEYYENKGRYNFRQLENKINRNRHRENMGAFYFAKFDDKHILICPQLWGQSSAKLSYLEDHLEKEYKDYSEVVETIAGFSFNARGELKFGENFRVYDKKGYADRERKNELIKNYYEYLNKK